MVPFISPGVTIYGAVVSGGYLYAYNVVASKIISLVEAQIATYPSYALVTSGHSLGGALASIAAISLKQNFPSK